MNVTVNSKQGAKSAITKIKNKFGLKRKVSAKQKANLAKGREISKIAVGLMKTNGIKLPEAMKKAKRLYNSK